MPREGARHATQASGEIAADRRRRRDRLEQAGLSADADGGCRARMRPFRGSALWLCRRQEALLHLALAHAFGMALDEATLPYGIASPEETLHLLKREIKRAAVWPVLSERMRDGIRLRPDDLSLVAGELFDVMHGRRRSVWLLDRCAQDIPEIAALYVKQVKARYLDDLAAFLGAGQAQGLFHRDLDPAIAARALLEMIAWLAMHRLRDALPLPADEDQVRRAAVSLVTRAVSASTGRVVNASSANRPGRRRQA